jgi:hypothetical protein
MGHVYLGRLADIFNAHSEVSKDSDEKLSIIYLNMACLLKEIVSKTGVDVLNCVPEHKIFLNRFEKKVHSQYGQDGIVEKIFELIGVEHNFYVDIGEESSKFLRLDKKFEGSHLEKLSLDGVKERFEKFKSSEIDIVSLSTHGDEWYLWKEIAKYSKPRVVAIEYNGEFDVLDDKVVMLGQTKPGTDYFGATLQALVNLGRSLGYSLVCCNNTGTTAFFVRNEIVPDGIHGVNDVRLLYRSLKSNGSTENGYFVHDTESVWTSSKEIGF